MPKETRTRSGSFERRSCASPLQSSRRRHTPSSSSSRNPTPPMSSASPAKDIKEWDEVHCPVCMEHPHNAVLLLCTSRDKGCRPFMCDTSYRHSNCLDQFRKAFSGSHPIQENDETQEPRKLICPLCRGQVTGWTVVEPARRYMNTKSRSCSLETCSFSGVYGELRKHARTEHPSVCPTEADPERERNWRRMEQQRDIGDLISTLQSAIGGERRRARVGGYIEEDGEELEGGVYPFHPVAFYFVVRVRLPGLTSTEQSPLLPTRGQTRPSQRRRRRRGTNLWGETYSEPELAGRISSDDNDNDNDDAGFGDGEREEASRSPRRDQGRRQRRRLRMSDDDNDDDEELL